jgi:FkbM family methyltransferase
MVTLIGLIRTLIVLNNPVAGLPYENRKVLKFRNSWKLNLTYSQFRDFRDSYSALKKYRVEQVNDNHFQVDFKVFKIVRRSIIICSIADLLKRYQINQIEEDVFRIKGDKFELEGTSYMLLVLAEQLKGDYEGNYDSKVVLDVGGFQGETAVLFSLAGAKKVIIYEPVPGNQKFIKKNVELNHVNAEIHEAGIGCENAIIKVKPIQPEDNFGFSPTNQQFDMKIDNISDVISSSKADMAKIDCEGAELCLNTVPKEVLQKIPCYIIELHGEEIRNVLTKKFLSTGFKITKTITKSHSLSTITFLRQEVKT